MQLIFDSESAIDVNKKMTSVTSEKLDEKLCTINGFKNNDNETANENGAMDAVPLQKYIVNTSLENGNSGDTKQESEPDNAVEKILDINEGVLSTNKTQDDVLTEESQKTSVNQESIVDEGVAVSSEVNKISSSQVITINITNTDKFSEIDKVGIANLDIETQNTKNVVVSELKIVDSIVTAFTEQENNLKSSAVDVDTSEETSYNTNNLENENNTNDEFSNIQNEAESTVKTLQSNNIPNVSSTEEPLKINHEGLPTRDESEASKILDSSSEIRTNETAPLTGNDKVDKLLSPICVDSHEGYFKGNTSQNDEALIEPMNMDNEMCKDKSADNVIITHSSPTKKDSNDIITDGSITEIDKKTMPCTEKCELSSKNDSDDIITDDSIANIEESGTDVEMCIKNLEEDLERLSENDSNDNIMDNLISQREKTTTGVGDCIKTIKDSLAETTERDSERISIDSPVPQTEQLNLDISDSKDVQNVKLKTDSNLTDDSEFKGENVSEEIKSELNTILKDDTESFSDKNSVGGINDEGKVVSNKETMVDGTQIINELLSGAETQENVTKDDEICSSNANAMDICLEVVEGHASTKNNKDNSSTDLPQICPAQEIKSSENVDTNAGLGTTDKENMEVEYQNSSSEIEEIMSSPIENSTKEISDSPAISINKKLTPETNKDVILLKDTSKATEGTVNADNKSKPHKKYSLLSNTLDILSDEEDEAPKVETKSTEEPTKTICSDIKSDKQCINVDDDDDIMVIDDEPVTKIDKSETIQKVEPKASDNKESDLFKITNDVTQKINENRKMTVEEKKDLEPDKSLDEPIICPVISKPIEETTEIKTDKPLVPENFLKAYKKNIADMTREDLEEFCLLKIVEGIVDRSSLSDIKNKLKTMSHNYEECKKKVLSVTKQNRDLQVVLKSIQEEQKKSNGNTPITPLKITRSVGMQIVMQEKNSINMKRKTILPIQPQKQTPPSPQLQQSNPPSAGRGRPRIQTPSPAKTQNNQQIPVPRLVPANSSNNTTRSGVLHVPGNTSVRLPIAVQNGMKNPASTPKVAEKRPRPDKSFTVDLTDDEPPPKQLVKNNPVPPVRLVNPQNLLAPRPVQPANNTPRKLFIPQNSAGIMVRTVTPPGAPRPRLNTPMVRIPGNRVNRMTGPNRHPAPLPLAMKQYQPPNWKALPPAPDLKLSKVENGIVISWKIDGYHEDSYEEIASYQLYAYQETCLPPSTNLWKKIGDVKALPLPMACTLTQFMAGYKYYFAVRAVDIRSRLGPFSLPGSILLLNK